ncbi:MAG: pitrilysin family protein [Xanthobacteraceae bacterium]
MSGFVWIGARRALALATLVLALSAGFALPASAMKIERIVSPGGIEAWLVREPSLPLIAMEFAFGGGSSQDPADKPGLSHMVTTLLDEGAGDLDSRAFNERLEGKAIELKFTAGRDTITGSLRTLVDHRDEAFDLLKLALTAPRFDPDAVERMRAAILSELRRRSTQPSELATRQWWETAFPGHPYGHAIQGTVESVEAITAADLKAYIGRTFARDTLKIGIVGDIDAETAGRLIDSVFGTLPAQAKLTPVPDVEPQALGRRVPVKLDVPQTSLVLGGKGLARLDPDYMAAYLVNHILGGGSFTSRLYHEVREKRGLAYSVYSSLFPLKHTAAFFVVTGTRADRAKETVDVIESEVRRIAQEGPTADELAKAKSYVKGVYALAFDSSPKIASQLVQIQLDKLGIDYVNRRIGMIDAVTVDDAKRVAKRLLGGGLLVTDAGPTQDAVGKAPAMQ